MTHWYDKDGVPHYGASLKEARENKYYLSVTSVEDVMYKYELEQWKIKQAIMSALTLPKKTNEADNDYTDRIICDSRQQARKAAKLGTVIHHMAERYINKRPLFFKGLRPDVWVLFKPLQKWIDDNIESGTAEKVLVDTLYHFAGKADIEGITKDYKYILPDIKTTFIIPDDIKKDGNIKKTKIRDSWGRQLSALRFCTQYEPDEVLSVIVSTNPAFQGVWTYEWSGAELDKHFEVFKAALKLAQVQKGLIYD